MKTSRQSQGSLDGSTQRLLTTDKEEDITEDGSTSRDGSPNALRHLLDVISNCGVGFLWLTSAVVSGSLQLVLMAKVSNIFNTAEALFFRSSFLIFSIVLVSWRKSESFGLVELSLYVYCGLADSLYVTLAGFSSNYIWVGDISAIVLNAPIPSSIIACIFLAEPLRSADFLLIVVNAVGLVLVSKPSFLFPHGDVVAEVHPLAAVGVLMAFASLLTGVTSVIAVRALVYRASEDAPLLATFTGLTGLCLAMFVSPVTSSWSLPTTLTDWSIVILLGLLAICSYVSVAKSLESVNVLTLSVALTLSIPLNYVFDFYSGREPDWISLGGVILILGSTLSLFLSSKMF